MQDSSVYQLKNYIEKKCGYFAISNETITEFFEEIIISKKSNFLTEGEISKYEGFIVEGCCKSFLIDNDGNEVILNLSTENWWISDLISFQERKPAQLTICALEKTTILALSFDKKEKLLENHPELERMFRILVQKHLVSLQKRVFNNFALTAEQRYEMLKTKRPYIFQRVPQYLIASYLGITPEFLSRLRAKTTRN